MAFRILLDAGVLLDLTLKRDKYPVTRQLIEWTMKGRVQAFVTPSIIQAIAGQVRAAYGPVRARELLLALLAEVQVIDMGHETAVSALHSEMSDLDGVFSYYAALHHKLDYFITRDERLQRAAIPVLPVCSPEEFLANNI